MLSNAITIFQSQLCSRDPLFFTLLFSVESKFQQRSKKKNKKINVIETKISKLFFFFFSFKRIAQQEAYL